MVLKLTEVLLRLKKAKLEATERCIRENPTLARAKKIQLQYEIQALEEMRKEEDK